MSADIADAAAKIAELKGLIEDLTKTATTVILAAETAAAIADITKARAEMGAMSAMPITFTVAINSAEALAELAVIRAIAGSAAGSIDIPVNADMTPLLAEIGAAKSAAASVGAMGIMGDVLWGTKGTFGFAQFGSVLSLAGFGFEHLMTTALGLAGSLSGASARRYHARQRCARNHGRR